MAGNRKYWKIYSAHEVTMMLCQGLRTVSAAVWIWHENTQLRSNFLSRYPYTCCCHAWYFDHQDTTFPIPAQHILLVNHLMSVAHIQCMIIVMYKNKSRDVFTLLTDIPRRVRLIPSSRLNVQVVISGHCPVRSRSEVRCRATGSRPRKVTLSNRR